MLKAGDKVKKKNGTTFSNCEYIVTVDKIENSFGDGDVVWLLETKTWVSLESLEHAYKKQNEVQIIKEKIKNTINNKYEEIKSLEDDIKKLNYALVTLEEIDD